MEPALVVTDVKKRYASGTEALKGVSLTVPAGDFFALLGPNGAGKTTIIGIVTGLVNKTGGDVKVFGYDIDGQPEEAKAQIGLVGLEINFNPFEKPIDIINSEVENAGSKTATGAGAELIKFSVKAPLVNPDGAKADDKSAAGKKAKKASKAAR